MKITYRIDEADYMAAHDLFAANERPWYRKLTRKISLIVAVFLLGSNIFYVFVVPRPDWILVAIGLVAACFLIYIGLAMRLYFRKSYRKDQRFRHEFAAEIADTGIDVITPLAKSQMTWNIFVRVLESERIFMLFVAPWQFLIFPKRYLTSAQVEQFQNLLRSHNINVEPSE